MYGHVVPIHPVLTDELFDLAHVFAGGRVVYTSDQHFGVGSNLILPGRGECPSAIVHLLKENKVSYAIVQERTWVTAGRRREAGSQATKTGL